MEMTKVIMTIYAPAAFLEGDDDDGDYDYAPAA